jgi:hypothetical protein
MSNKRGLSMQAVPVSHDTRLRCDVVSPLWGHRGLRPAPAHEPHGSQAPRASGRAQHAQAYAWRIPCTHCIVIGEFS